MTKPFFLIIIGFIFTNFSTHGATFQEREHRGAWIASVDQIDWPKSPSSSVATHQEELRFMVHQLAEAGINAIYFQVRPAGDALYQSEIEPWSRYLTGAQGTSPIPLWDPLDFVIQLCQPLNIEVHAWINPYRASLSPTHTLAPNHMAILYPQCAYRYDTYVWMDPGCPQVQNRSYNVALDLVSRYDLDGLHMDDYFYPYPVTGWTFPDNATYEAYIQSGGMLDLEDWRRDNVNVLILRMQSGIHEAKPWVKFSVSPFGIFRAGHPEGMPSPIEANLDQYSEIYCDAKLWLQEGWVDILQPQLYWRIAPPQQSYPALLGWWVGEDANPLRRHVYAGQYLTRIDLQDWPLSEIRDQIEISRLPENRQGGSWGNIQFSAKILRDDFKGAVGYFKNFIYSSPALQPAFPWLSNATFEKVEGMRPAVVVSSNEGLSSVKIRVGDENKGVAESSEIIYKIAIYYQPQGQWVLYKIIHASKDFLSGTVKLSDLMTGNYAVTFVNRVGQESRKSFFEIN